MDNHLLPANPARYADDFRADTVGILAATQVGRRLGKVDYTLPNGAFLRCHALLRGIAIFYNYLYIRYKILCI